MDPTERNLIKKQQNINMCKNYTFLQYVYNDEFEDTDILNIMKSRVYGFPEVTNSADVPTLKSNLKYFFGLMPAT